MNDLNAEQSEISNKKRNSTGYVKGAPAAIISKLKDPGFHKQALWTLISIVLALLVAAVIMAMAGYDAGRAFVYLLVGAIREPDRVLQFATPLILTGLSVAIAFKCGLFNIGAEGQLYIGSIAAAVVGFTISLPYLVHPLLCLVIAAAFGGLYSLIPGLLKAYRGAHEVVTTMMLSYAAILMTSWLVGPNGFWMDIEGSELIPQTPLLHETAILPTIGGPYLHWGILVSVLSVIAVDFLINRTVLGYEMRAVGLSREAAEYAGINPKRNITLALTISGALAGLAGGGEVMGTYNRFIHHWSPGLGWDGITVAVLGNNNPWGVLGGAIFFAALRAGGNAMQISAGVPQEMVGVIQGLVVLFVAAPRIVEWLRKQTVEYRSWARSEVKLPIDYLLGTMLSVVGIFISFGLLIASLSGILVSASLFALGMVTIATFGFFLSRNRNASLLLTLMTIGWFAAAIVDLLSGGVFVAGVAGVMGLLCLIDIVLLRKRAGNAMVIEESAN